MDQQGGPEAAETLAARKNRKAEARHLYLQVKFEGRLGTELVGCSEHW